MIFYLLNLSDQKLATIQIVKKKKLIRKSQQKSGSDRRPKGGECLARSVNLNNLMRRDLRFNRSDKICAYLSTATSPLV